MISEQLIITTFSVIQPVFLKSTPGLQYSSTLKVRSNHLVKYGISFGAYPPIPRQPLPPLWNSSSGILTAQEDGVEIIGSWYPRADQWHITIKVMLSASVETMLWGVKERLHAFSASSLDILRVQHLVSGVVSERNAVSTMVCWGIGEWRYSSTYS
jgi:hypothetical protein